MSMEKFVESNQKFAVNLVLGLIAWVFSVAVFLPVANVYAVDWVRLMAIFLLVNISYYFFKARKYSGPLFEYCSNKLTSLYMGWRKLEESNRAETWKSVRKFLKVFVIVVVYLMYRPLLTAVNVILPGIALILVLLQVLIYLVFPIKPIKLNFLKE